MPDKSNVCGWKHQHCPALQRTQWLIMDIKDGAEGSGGSFFSFCLCVQDQVCSEKEKDAILLRSFWKSATYPIFLFIWENRFKTEHWLTRPHLLLTSRYRGWIIKAPLDLGFQGSRGCIVNHLGKIYYIIFIYCFDLVGTSKQTANSRYLSSSSNVPAVPPVLYLLSSC